MSAHAQRQSPPTLLPILAPPALTQPSLAVPQLQKHNPLPQPSGSSPAFGNLVSRKDQLPSITPSSTPPIAPSTAPLALHLGPPVGASTASQPPCAAPPAPSAPILTDQPQADGSPVPQPPPSSERPSSGPADAAPATAPPAAAPAAPRPAVPATINVITGSLTGVFNVARLDVTLADGNTVSATEFERLAGRGSSKKWKVGVTVFGAVPLERVQT